MINKPLRAAIIGSGNIGTDILIKLQRSPLVDCTLFVGRRENSKGMKIAKQFTQTSADGIEALKRYHFLYDIVFDATSALAHQNHASVLRRLGKKVIDLTPAKLGQLCVPAINIEEVQNAENINLITCGGQASAPIAHAFGKAHEKIEYIEVVSSIASDSAGPATRINIDEYIDTTEKAVMRFSNCYSSKAILNINPGKPSVKMKTSLYAKMDNPNIELIRKNVLEAVQKVKLYVPGYKLLVPPYFDGERVTTMVEVTGRGDFLPPHAGNLDIITCAAVEIAQYLASQAKTDDRRLAA